LALRGELRPDSDVDVLVSFQEGAELTLFKVSRLAK
jgi:predicted nucleotidyltransferase